MRYSHAYMYVAAHVQAWRLRTVRSMRQIRRCRRFLYRAAAISTWTVSGFKVHGGGVEGGSGRQVLAMSGKSGSSSGSSTTTATNTMKYSALASAPNIQPRRTTARGMHDTAGQGGAGEGGARIILMRSLVPWSFASRCACWNLTTRIPIVADAVATTMNSTSPSWPGASEPGRSEGVAKSKPSAAPMQIGTTTYL